MLTVCNVAYLDYTYVQTDHGFCFWSQRQVLLPLAGYGLKVFVLGYKWKKPWLKLKSIALILNRRFKEKIIWYRQCVFLFTLKRKCTFDNQ